MGNYCVLPEYHKCVFSPLTWMMGLTMHLFSREERACIYGTPGVPNNFLFRIGFISTSLSNSKQINGGTTIPLRFGLVFYFSVILILVLVFCRRMLLLLILMFMSFSKCLLQMPQKVIFFWSKWQIHIQFSVFLIMGFLFSSSLGQNFIVHSLCNEWLWMLQCHCSWWSNSGEN